jgi:hypothetical protein
LVEALGGLLPECPGSAKGGERLSYVPEQTLIVSLDCMRALSTGIALEAHADAAYQSEVNTQIDPSAASYVQLSGYTTLNGSTTLSFGSQWRARLYGNNVTNHVGVTAAGPILQSADYPSYREEYLIRPRTIGISVEYRFE